MSRATMTATDAPSPGRARSWVRRAGIVLATLAAAWLAGFGWFLYLATAAGFLPAHADGIVALTGGTERVESALHLLAEGRADRLLISGVGGAAEFSSLAHRARVDPKLAPLVTLGRAAASTRGNAEETAGWARIQRVRTLIVVTAFYHMPRAMVELSRALPDVTLYPAPVHPAALREGPGLGWLRLLTGEYMKFIAAETGLTGFAARVLERNGA